MKENKTIIFIISGSLSDGGAERFVSTLISHLDSTLFSISLCILQNRIVYPLPQRVILFHLDYYSIAHLPLALLKLRSFIKKSDPDIILSNVADTNRLIGSVLFTIRKKPCWIARIGSNPFRDGKSILRRFLNILWSKAVYPMAYRFVVNNASLSLPLQRLYPCTRNKIIEINNPVNLRAVQEQSNEFPCITRDATIPLLISMGRFHRAKRFDILIEAFALLLRRMQARLWIIGKGYLKDTMEADIRKRALQDAVTLIDFCKNPYPLLRQADCFVLTSDYEGMPNALIEAMILGLPVVATDCPYGPAQLIDHGVNGYLTPRGSPPEIALWAEKLLVNPDRKAMGKRGAEKAGNIFEVSAQMKKWERLFLNRSGAI